MKMTRKKEKRKKRKLRKQQESSSHQLRKRGHLARKTSDQKRRKQSVRIRRVAGSQASIPLLISSAPLLSLIVKGGISFIKCTLFAHKPTV